MRERFKRRLQEKIKEHETQDTYILTEKNNNPDSTSLVKIVFLNNHNIHDPIEENIFMNETTVETKGVGSARSRRQLSGGCKFTFEIIAKS